MKLFPPLVTLFALFSLFAALHLRPASPEKAIFAGDGLLFTCIGDANVVLKWFHFNGDEIHFQPNSRIYSQKIDNGLQLINKRVSKIDEGVYKCASYKEDNLQFKGEVKIKVIVANPIKLIVNETNRLEESKVSLTCEVLFDESTSEPAILWHRVDNEGKILARIDENDKYLVITSNSGHPLKLKSILVITAIQPKDEGNYVCKALMITPHLSQIKDFPIRLTIKSAPQFINEGLVVWVEKSKADAVNVTCSVVASPPAQLTWATLDDHVIREDSHHEQVIAICGRENENILTIAFMRKGDGVPLNRVKCKAENEMGAKETVIEVRVGERPPVPKLVGYLFEEERLRLYFKAEDIEPLVDFYRVSVDDHEMDINITNGNHFHETEDVVDVKHIPADYSVAHNRLIIWGHNKVGFSAPLRVDNKLHNLEKNERRVWDTFAASLVSHLFEKMLGIRSGTS